MVASGSWAYGMSRQSKIHQDANDLAWELDSQYYANNTFALITCWSDILEILDILDILN